MAKENEGLADGSKVDNTNQVPLFFGMALFLSCLPVYLYVNVYNLTIEEFGIVYLPVTVLSSFLLTLSYRTVSNTTFAQLSRSHKAAAANHKKIGLSRGELSAVQEQITSREAMAWSLIFNNTVFILSFLFFAFYALGLLGAPYQYSVAMIISAATVWQLSSSLYKQA